MGVTSSYDPPRNASSLAEFVRRHDPDRFLTALFAPADKREALFALYAFNHELARAREVVSEPPLALIRLHWWREVVEGADRRHEVAEPLSAALHAGALHRQDLLAIIDARETEAEPGFETLDQWLQYVKGSAGGLAVAAGRLLGAPDSERLRPIGAAYGIAGLLRSAEQHARQGRRLLPAGVPQSQLVAEGLGLLQPLALPRRAIAAALPAVLARRDLRRAPRFPRQRALGDQLAVLLAAVRKRV
jgi:15-cis-phytoene synthase